MRKRIAAGNVVVDEVRWSGRADGKNPEGVGVYEVRDGLIRSIRAAGAKPAGNGKNGK